MYTGARVAALAQPGEILVSRTIRDLVAGSPIRLERRGTHELKGVPGPWEIFAVTGPVGGQTNPCRVMRHLLRGWMLGGRQPGSGYLATAEVAAGFGQNRRAGQTKG